jgi:hypothetical protein
MSRNIAPWMVATTSSCGVRANAVRVRRATTRLLVTKPAPDVSSWWTGRVSVAVVRTGLAVAVVELMMPSDR